MRRKAIVAVAAVVSMPLWLPHTCPIQHLFLTSGTRALIALKNRTDLPAPADYDARVTLGAMVESGPDETRWSERRAARIEGFLVRVQSGGIELSNCLSVFNRDTHLEIAVRPDAPPTERVIVEVTPLMRRYASTAGVDWSNAALGQLVGRRVRVDGWLLFDREHADEAEHSRPGDPGNWRATAWELHPVTALSQVP